MVMMTPKLGEHEFSVLYFGFLSTAVFTSSVACCFLCYIGTNHIPIFYPWIISSFKKIIESFQAGNALLCMVEKV